jgi:hypothetical protein
VDDDDKNDEHHVETLPKKKQKPDEDIDANDKEEDVDALAYRVLTWSNEQEVVDNQFGNFQR